MHYTTVSRAIKKIEDKKKSNIVRTDLIIYVNKEGVHWVSYHFAKENEIKEKDTSFENYLKILSM